MNQEQTDKIRQLSDVDVQKLLDQLSASLDQPETEVMSRLIAVRAVLERFGIRNPLHLRRVAGDALSSRHMQQRVLEINRKIDRQANREQAERSSLSEYDAAFSALAGENWLVFMNHGFAPLSQNSAQAFPRLVESDQSWRHQIFLYLFLLRAAREYGDCEPDGRTRLIDIGCGRGGGVSAMSRYYAFEHCTGLDLNQQQVDFCHARHRASDLTFVTGSALSLPFDDDSFNIATNVESSHLYGDIGSFIAEAHRVLRPGGMLLLADTRMPVFGEYALDAAIEKSDFTLCQKLDITRNVIAACDIDKESLGKQWNSAKTSVPRRIAAHKQREYESGWSSYYVYILASSKRRSKRVVQVE